VLAAAKKQGNPDDLIVLGRLAAFKNQRALKSVSNTWLFQTIPTFAIDP
jgi:hypothetical protein